MRREREGGGRGARCVARTERKPDWKSVPTASAAAGGTRGVSARARKKCARARQRDAWARGAHRPLRTRAMPAAAARRPAAPLAARPACRRPQAARRACARARAHMGRRSSDQAQPHRTGAAWAAVPAPRQGAAIGCRRACRTRRSARAWRAAGAAAPEAQVPLRSASKPPARAELPRRRRAAAPAAARQPPRGERGAPAAAQRPWLHLGSCCSGCRGRPQARQAPRGSPPAPCAACRRRAHAPAARCTGQRAATDSLP